MSLYFEMSLFGQGRGTAGVPVAKEQRAQSRAMLAVMVLGFSLCCCASLACFFPHSMMFDGASRSIFRAYNSSFGFASCVAAVVYGIVTIRSSRLFSVGAFVGYAALVVGLSLMACANGRDHVASIAGALCGAGLSCAMVFWFGALTYFRGKRVMAIQGWQALLGGLLFATLLSLSYETARAIIIIAAAASCACAVVLELRFSREEGELPCGQFRVAVRDARAHQLACPFPLQEAEGAENPCSAVAREALRSAALATLGFVAVAFLYGALTPVAASNIGFPRTSPVVIWGGPVGAIGFLAGVHFWEGRRWAEALQAIFGMLAGALLLAPFDVTLAVFGAGYQVCGLLFYSLIVNELLRCRGLVVLFVAVGYALVHLAFLAGLFVPGYFGVSSHEAFAQSASFVMFVAYALVGVLLLVVHRDKRRELCRLQDELSRQREEQEDLRRASAKTLDEEYAVVCEELGSEIGLTRREAEVLAFLARGRDVAFVCSELCLARNTVKGYTKRIYAKLGVHSKQELIDCVERKRKGEPRN